MIKTYENVEEFIKENSEYLKTNEYRGKGYARKVVAALQNEILDSGCKAVLNVDKNNPISNALYKSLGFIKLFSHGEYRRIDD